MPKDRLFSSGWLQRDLKAAVKKVGTWSEGKRGHSTIANVKGIEVHSGTGKVSKRSSSTSKMARRTAKQVRV